MAGTVVIVTRLNARQTGAVLRGLPAALSARRTGGAGAAVRKTLVRIGLAVQERIHSSFVAKSKGGSDETGAAWKKLSPYTLALRRARARRRSKGKQQYSTDILRDRGDLEASLRPATTPGQAGDSPPRVRLQVFRLAGGSVTVGTRRRHALTHHEGAGKIPQRRLWPEVGSWPTSWWDDILRQAQQGVIDVLILQLARQP